MCGRWEHGASTRILGLGPGAVNVNGCSLGRPVAATGGMGSALVIEAF
jgi:hypothetical protein